MTVRGMRSRAPEPESRRTYQPVRRNSRPKGCCEGWRPFDRRKVGRNLRALERWARNTKEKGARKGVVGDVAQMVYRVLHQLIDFATGRLDPCIKTLEALTGKSHDAVCRGLKELRRVKLIDWVNRQEPADTAPGVRGPQVKQASNAYTILPLPPAAAILVPQAPPPEDVEHRRERMVRELRAMETEAFDDQVAARRRLRLGRNASPPGGHNPSGGS